MDAHIELKETRRIRIEIFLPCVHPPLASACAKAIDRLNDHWVTKPYFGGITITESDLPPFTGMWINDLGKPDFDRNAQVIVYFNCEVEKCPPVAEIISQIGRDLFNVYAGNEESKQAEILIVHNPVMAFSFKTKK